MYVTVYVKKVKRRGKSWTDTLGCAYSTKALTDMHAHIRKAYPGAKTYRDPKRVITNLLPGVNLGTMPIVTGGEVVTD